METVESADELIREALATLTPTFDERDLLIALLVVLWLVALWGWRRARTRLSRASRRRNRRARRAETEAERLLEAQGFAILERQLTQRWQLEVDGEPQEVLCRADLLVERRRRLYVADVKSGKTAPDPRQPATRRQLLEYLLAFDVDGALVVDMQRRQVHAVAFPGLLSALKTSALGVGGAL